MTNFFSKLKGKSLKNKNFGFSLIELSVIVSVAAILTIGYLSWTEPRASSNADKATVTRDKIRNISKAIDNFVLTKKRLPCPADVSILPDNTSNSGYQDIYVNDFGNEDLDISDTALAGDPIITWGADCLSSRGFVPAKALGLTIEDMYDGWGKFFTYQVSSTLCGSDRGTDPSIRYPQSDSNYLSWQDSLKIGCTPYDYATKEGNIIVKHNNDITLTNRAAYVVLSHGANGLGAILPGGAMFGTPSGDEQINSDENSNIFIKAQSSEVFDDIILFKNRNQINKNITKNYSENNKTSYLLSVEECNNNSTKMSEITLNVAKDLNTYFNSFTQDSKGTGQEVALSIMKSLQDVCVKYYGALNDSSNSWIGAKCPGNSLSNEAISGSTYIPATGVCVCSSGLWDGNCTIGNIEVKGRFVGVGNNGTILTSDDGAKTWGARNAPENINYNDVAYGNNIYVAVADNEKAALSEDYGVTWTSISTNGSDSNNDWQHIVFGNNKFVASGNLGYFLTSLDGKNWSSQYNHNKTINDFIFANDKFIATTSDGKILISGDTVNWSQISCCGTDNFKTLTYGGGKFVAIATNSKKSYTSNNGRSWVMRNQVSTADIGNVRFGGGVFIATLGNDKIAISSDGISWREEDFPELTSNGEGIEFGGNSFVIFKSNWPANRSYSSLDTKNWMGATTPDNKIIKSVVFGGK